MNAVIILSLWIYFFSLLGNIDGKAKLTLKINKFHSFSNRRLDGKCCGVHIGNSDPSICGLSYLQKFRICLENYHSKVTPSDSKPYGGPCSYGVKESLIWDKSESEDNKQYIYSYNFDIQNAWPMYMMVIIESYDASDRDPFNHAVIDRVAYRNFLKPAVDGKHESIWHDITLANGQSVYEFRIKLVCQKDYFGVGCDKHCRDSTGNNNYRCDDRGNKVCSPGWIGTDCNITTCKPGCHSIHGFCKKPGECSCTAGWTGPYCDECIKYPGCLYGTCIDSPWTCYCQPNWGGYFCDKSLNHCGENHPCKNEGICENQPYQSDPYKCICPSGFHGKNCEIDNCSPNPCKKGSCMRTKTGFHCECFTDWTGKYCEQDQRICDPFYCKNGGKCQQDENGMLRCTCSAGFRGSVCQFAAPCGNSECKNIKECPSRSNFNKESECICEDGWTGKYCDKDINECDNNPCKNDGTCKNIVGDYKCQCKESFQGRNCEINTVCDNKPCKNGGVCQIQGVDFVCKCKNDYSGKYCETFKTSCSPNPCQNGAYCYTIDQGFYCQCQSDYWGQYCEHSRPYCGTESCQLAHDPCFMPSMNSSKVNRDVCGQYGSCINKGKGHYECKCQFGFEGMYCEKNIDDCSNNPCENGGTCIDGINDYECLCENGYQGKKCDERIDYCSKNPCLNGGQCKPKPAGPYNDFICECTHLWGGRLCHQSSSDNQCDDSTCLHGGRCSIDRYGTGAQRCDCKPGWTGSICQFRQEQSRPCYDNNRCKNGGICVNFGDSDYMCHCPGGYEGKNCENDINECHPNPCFNGGTCGDQINSYKCDCPKGFFGSRCQSDFDACISNPCAYGSVCIDRIEGYECRCPVGRNGTLCDQVVNSRPPQPPSCIYHNRTFDSGQHWSYNCENCKCDSGKISCKKDKCGVWSCLKANGVDDPFKCKSDEDCHQFPFDTTRCFVSPCVARAKCIKRNREIPNILVAWPGNSGKHCRPNGNEKNNNCAQILLKFEKKNMPVGVTIDDICDAIKLLPVIKRYQNDVRGDTLGVSCEINEATPSIVNVAIYSQNNEMVMLKSTNTRRPFVHFLSDQMADNLIEVVRTNYSILSGLVDIKVETLLLQSDVSDQSSLMKYLLIPLLLLGVFIIIVIIWHHRRKMVEIQESFSKPSKPATNVSSNNNNCHFQSIPQYPHARPNPHNSGAIGPIQTKYQAFPGDPARSQNIPSIWSHGHPSFKG